MPCYNISGEAAFIFDNLIIRVVDDKVLCSGNETVVEGISYGSTSTYRAFGIMAIRDMHTEMTTIPQNVNDRLGMGRYEGHKVKKASIPIHAICSHGDRIDTQTSSQR